MTTSIKPNIDMDFLEKIDVRVGTVVQFDIGYADGIIPVLAQPEKPVPNGTRVG
jgi:hypothetical protein